MCVGKSRIGNGQSVSCARCVFRGYICMALFPLRRNWLRGRFARVRIVLQLGLFGLCSFFSFYDFFFFLEFALDAGKGKLGILCLLRDGGFGKR